MVQIYELFKGRIHVILDSFSCQYQKVSGMEWTATPTGYRTGTSCLHASNVVPERLTDRELNLSSHSSIFTSVSVDSSPRCYLFTFATVRIPVQTEPKCGTKPVRFVTLDFRDERDAASLQYRSLVEIKRERTPFPVWFRAGVRAIRHTVNVPYDHRKLKTMALSFALRIPLWLT